MQPPAAELESGAQVPAWSLRRFALKGSLQRFVFAAAFSLILAFVWPVLSIKLADKNSIFGTVIIIAPSIVFILISTFCVLRLILHAFSQAADDS